MKLLVIALAAVTALALSGLAVAGATPGVAPPSSNPYGASYGEWQARWGKWAAEIPVSQNPGFDESGERCAVGQTGNVWFSAFASHPGTTERTCTLRPGTALFLLVVGNECSTAEPPPFFGSNEAELRACAAEGYEFAFGDASYSVKVDGREVEDLADYRTQTPLYSLVFPQDNIFGATPGPALAVSDGIWVMLRPLSVGSHRVEVHIEAPALGGVVDANYTIIVEPES
jgi:hypothetical protein